MTTPAQEMGLIVNETLVKVTNGDDTVYRFVEDDKSSCPFFRRLTDDYLTCISLINLEIVEGETQKPAALNPVPPAPQVFADTPAGRMGIAQDSTIVYYDGNASPKGHYTMIHDDDTNMPRFARIPQECDDGEFKDWLHLDCVKVIDPETLPKMEENAMLPAQRKAFETFTRMHEEAVKYRKGESSEISTRDGICDNIDKFARMVGARTNHMHDVKENLIRRVPSYSGSYHYPVPGPAGTDADDAFSGRGMWDGEYGENRVRVLAEIIELIKTDWENDLTGEVSAARRVGLKVGDIVLYTRNGENSVWVFRHDDRSGNPSFHRLGDPNRYNDIELCYIKKAPKTEYGEMPVSAFIAKLEEKENQKKEIEAQIKELKAKLESVNMESAILDAELAKQHKVARIK